MNAVSTTPGAAIPATLVASDLQLVNPTPIIAFAQRSLTTAASTAQRFSASVSQSFQQATVLTYTERFANAYETRVDPTVSGQASGQSASLLQDVPGPLYNSESSFTLANPASAQVPGTNIGVVEITPPPGSTTATAVWEVVSATPFDIERFHFAAFVSYSGYAATAGAATVNLSYAPTSTAGSASDSASIPRFLDTSSASPAFHVSGCGGAITLTASPNPAVYGQNVIISGVVPGGAGGTAALMQDPDTVFMTGQPVLGNGTMSAASWQTSSLSPGIYSLYATY
ncbi:MAG TPA: hypothetical protein VKV17_09810 [Bryobacteraceae bacterium]|nr:hypothetical protein [Bryobacteraceae bacterium]